VGYLSDAPAITAALRGADLSDQLVVALVPLILAAGAGLRNMLKNAGRL
jgi:hypothetical protein